MTPEGDLPERIQKALDKSMATMGDIMLKNAGINKQELFERLDKIEGDMKDY